MTVSQFIILFFLAFSIENQGLEDAIKVSVFQNDKAQIQASKDDGLSVKLNETLDAKLIIDALEKGAVADNKWVLANKQNPLPKGFAPKDIIKAKVKQKYGNTTVSKVMHSDLVALFEAASKDGIVLVLSSGYRDYGFQASLYQQQVKKVGEKEANRWVAKPGESEHQTGLAVDITSREVELKLTQEFEQTKAFEWLSAHAADFGFILRYPKGKEDETGYSYEPWHYRYLGDPKAARYIQENGVTLEAFIKELKTQ